jgi:hypothetical protein
MSVSLTKLDAFLRAFEADQVNVLKQVKLLDVEIPKTLFADDTLQVMMKAHKISKKDNHLRYSIILSTIRSAGNAGSPTNKLKLASRTLYECEIEESVQGIWRSSGMIAGITNQANR